MRTPPRRSSSASGATKGRIEEIKQFIREIYADNPPWLQLPNVQIDDA
ncbi:hypothetical protein SAMCFNEI73_Ch2921 [Sinorhizobium americanum]|uniref:Uncharacterized protein n=1 Tax=Sinorhizobium americanum TaxID=194963 RepID=A0A1L3LQ25_9HYPH|nr:hypothetical protein SAMCCGM7_Ch2797 [Sinorhizobium americanum CCGM7]APG92194.1 hypothetical protein SAMCFNEI73_Ch2921 [Sinorhizobium americanum]